MKNFLIPIASLSATVFLGVLTAVAALNEAVSLQQNMLSLHNWAAHILSWTLYVPWWGYLGAMLLFGWITFEVFKLTHQRDVVIKGDHTLVDLRAAKEVALDFTSHANVLIRPTQATRVHPPGAPTEGIHRFFVLLDEMPHQISFSEEFEFVGGSAGATSRQANHLYEYQIVIIKDGTRFRYFVSDLLAYVDAINQASAEATEKIEEAKRVAIRYAMIT